MDLGCAVSRVPSSDYLFVLIDANARSGRTRGHSPRKSDTLLRSAEEVMRGQIRQSRLFRLFEDKATHAELEEAWTEREEARMAVRGALVEGSAFRALRKARRKFREVMQAAEDRYLEVHACELEEFPKTVEMKRWYGHLKGGWRLQGKKVGSAQYIGDEDGKLLRKLEEIRAR